MPSRIPEVPTTGVWYRHVQAGAPPMPGHPAPDGRWQRGEQLAGLCGGWRYDEACALQPRQQPAPGFGQQRLWLGLSTTNLLLLVAATFAAWRFSWLPSGVSA